MTINRFQYIFCFLSLLFMMSCADRYFRESKVSPLDNVDPTIGNIAPLLNPNRPVVHLPNQMIRIFPNRYDHLDMGITDFPLIALNTITPQFSFGLKPTIGQVDTSSWKKRLSYDHDMELIQPHYYYNKLIDDNIEIEFVPSEKTGVYRFKFPKFSKKNILLSHYFPNGEFEVLDDGRIIGVEYVRVPWHDQFGKVFLYGEFSGNPILKTSSGELNWGIYSVGTWGGIKPSKMNGTKMIASFEGSDEEIIEFRYSISFIDHEQAKINFEELDDKSFEDLKESGKLIWDKTLSQIDVVGGSPNHIRSFYSALYRTYVRMININEGGRYFSGYDGKVHTSDRDFYVDDYTWGNYLALHPLRVLLDPEKEADMLQSYVNMYKQSGWMPEYPKHFGDRQGMFGFKSSVMFLDAFRKGIFDFDTEEALKGLIKNSSQATMLPFRNGPKGDLEEFYYKNGFYPALRPGEAESDPFALQKKGQVRSSVAITLSDAYDSWALGNFAKEIGASSELITDIYNRKNNYKNLWHPKLKMFIPKDSNGEWIEIDPKFDGGYNGFDYYNENNGWMYLWNVQHDFDGLVQLFGDKSEFENMLDSLYREPLDRSKYNFFAKFPNSTAMIGQFSFGNQVAFFIPYLYNFTDSPWKTQQITRFILDMWFQDNVFGCPGDDDAGSMSAFVVFSSLGFYPITPGIPEYALTSPVFPQSTINLPNGKSFKIVANNFSEKNKYIKSAHLNGVELKELFITHDDIMNGGELFLEMHSNPFE